MNLSKKVEIAGFWANELRILYFNTCIYVCKILILYIIMTILGSTSYPEMCLEGSLMNTAEKPTTPDYPVNSESWWGIRWEIILIEIMTNH